MTEPGKYDMIKKYDKDKMIPAAQYPGKGGPL